jgi:hypothetical protein
LRLSSRWVEETREGVRSLMSAEFDWREVLVRSVALTFALWVEYLWLKRPFEEGRGRSSDPFPMIKLLRLVRRGDFRIMLEVVDDMNVEFAALRNEAGSTRSNF